jgi:hypothetical protein
MPVAGGFPKAVFYGGGAVETLTERARGMLDRLAAKQKFSVLLRANTQGLLL